jgi:hypothetical protein
MGTSSWEPASKNKQWLLEQMMEQWANHVRAGAEVKIDAKAARQERHKESGHTGF